MPKNLQRSKPLFYFKEKPNYPIYFKEKPNYHRPYQPKTLRIPLHFTHSNLGLSKRIIVTTIFLLLISTAVIAETQKITFSHVSNSDHSVNAKIQRHDLGKQPSQNLINMNLVSKGTNISVECLRTPELGCRIDGAVTGSAAALRASHLTSVNPNLAVDFTTYPNYTSFDVTNHPSCSGEDDISTFDVLKNSKQTNIIVTGNNNQKEVILQYGNYGVVTQSVHDISYPSNGMTRAHVVERNNRLTSSVDNTIDFTVEKDNVKVQVNVLNSPKLTVMTEENDNSLTVQVSTGPENEIKLPIFKHARGCNPSAPQKATQLQGAKNTFFYHNQGMKTDVKFSSKEGETRASYLSS